MPKFKSFWKNLQKIQVLGNNCKDLKASTSFVASDLILKHMDMFGV